MPFAVVETTNVRGHKELSAVPEKWIRSSKSGSIIMWPNSKRVQDLDKILRDDISTLKKAWLKYKCAIKRNGLRSYDAAMNLCEEMSGESSSDAQPANRQRKKKINNQESASFQDMLVLDSSGPQEPPPPAVIAAGLLESPVAPLKPTAALLQPQAVPRKPPVGSLQAPVYSLEASAVPLQPQTIPISKNQNEKHTNLHYLIEL